MAGEYKFEIGHKKKKKKNNNKKQNKEKTGPG